MCIRDSLVSGHRVENLLAVINDDRLILILPAGGVAALAGTLLMPEDRLAVTVLDAVYQLSLIHI